MKKQLLSSSLLFPLLFSVQHTGAYAVEVDTILVTTSRTPTSANSAGSAVTVINNQELRDSQQPYLADVLRGVPGVAVSQSGSLGNTTQIRMRGTEANHVLVFIDGIKMNPADGGSVDFGNLLTDDIERVEILRGSQSALWGSDAVGGVIAITTRRGKHDESNAYINVEAGSYNSKMYSFGFTGGSKATRYAFNFNDSRTAGFSSADDDTFSYTLPNGTQVTQGGSGSENDAYKNTTIGGTLEHNFNKDLSIEAALRQINSDVNYDDFAGATGVFDSNTPNTKTDSIYAQATLRYAMLNNRLQTSFKIANSDIDKTFIGAFGTSKSRSIKNQYVYQMDYYFPQADNDKASHNISFSIEREINSNNSSFAGFNDNQSDSFILEYKFSYSEMFSSALTYRRDNNQIFQNADIIHANLSYTITPALRLHSSTGNGIKNPTLTELFGFSASFPGNAALRPEKTKSIDVGLEWKISKAHLVDITLFDLRIDDQITGSGQNSVNVSGESKATGLEFSYKGSVGKNWLLSSSITLQDSSDANGNNLIRRADTIASLSATHISLNNKLRTRLAINYNGSQSDSYFDASFNRSLVDVPAYTVANLSASYQFNKMLNITGRINNLFDEKYQEVIGYGTSDRAYYVGLRLSL